ncbi:MAG: hypothetical protein GWN93_11675 [Deltaproteobacteria bacterium]|nr:hypothetical protein [Deltaproteobacteria bacterium]
MDYRILANELITDPLGRGYSTMTDKEAAADMNTLYRTRELDILSGGVVYDAVDIPEFQALSTSGKAEVWNISHLGAEIPVGPTSKARSRFITLFGAQSDTISNLQDIITIAISRGEELGWGIVKTGDIEKARAL